MDDAASINGVDQVLPPSPSRKRPRQEDEGDSAVLLEYEEWLRSRGVWWDERVRLRAPLPSGARAGSTQGWGLTCLKPIAKGELLVRVPRAAALSTKSLPQAEALLAAAGVPEAQRVIRMDKDSQLPLCVALLLGAGEEAWLPKLRPQVTPASCPLAWSWPKDSSAAKLLVGTELESVISAKYRRLQEEYATLRRAPLPEHCDFDAYLRASTVIMSRVQPWWSGSLVPFVDMANHTWSTPHVEFRRRGDAIEGRAVTSVKVGEILQSYGELSTADALYRYGMASPATTAAAVRLRDDDVVTIGAEIIEAAVSAQANEVSTVPAAAAQRRPLLEAAGLFADSPWDGVNGLAGIEISICRIRRKGSKRRAGAAPPLPRGLRELVAAAALLLLPKDRWALAASAAASKSGEVDAAKALVAALLPGHGCGDPGEAILPSARNASSISEEESNWPALLPPGLAWATPDARSVAAKALRLREACYGGCLADDENGFEEASDAGNEMRRGALQLRICERRILAEALHALCSAEADQTAEAAAAQGAQE
eukprot:gnl/TRDRNA2_/TRDRNA2_151054_c0_seq3.p1 gnl/TRDRNA2_/TRDRNA2_151054_c0~~gnl/TRDRNA2_/TRDRNA2_151054_c0_seq3.p1  ORF type:complete len:541 (+),score=105.68 gnl/TRDRNA2_/TRDRNA2_151054_c0_seq3:43-1665(+)